MLDRLHITYCLVITVLEIKVENNKWRTFSFNRSAPVLSYSPADARQAIEHSVCPSPPSVPEDTVLIPTELSENSRCLDLNHNLKLNIGFFRDLSSHSSTLLYFFFFIIASPRRRMGWGLYQPSLSEVESSCDFIKSTRSTQERQLTICTCNFEFPIYPPDKHIFRLGGSGRTPWKLSQTKGGHLESTHREDTDLGIKQLNFTVHLIF